MTTLLPTDRFGLVKPLVDVHTLGLTTVMNLLEECGYKVFLAPSGVNTAMVDIQKINNWGIVRHWLSGNGITFLGFSYRLDPKQGCDYFCRLYYLLQENRFFARDGGILRQLFFAGLPDTCELIRRELDDEDVLLFPGDETPVETLSRLGVPDDRLPSTLLQDNYYDNMRWKLAEKLIADGAYKLVGPQDHYGYPECGTRCDLFLARLRYCKDRHTLPLIRAHVGPYNPDRTEALQEFGSWTKELAASRLLDVFSIGSSQLSQSNFGENWEGKANGGGVPVNSEQEYTQIAAMASPMLVRTYAGTKSILELARMYERAINISWHALSFWWFSEIDGRGTNTVLENLREHIETIRYIASTGKPLEPNVPHHFAFRGTDDASYVISGYLAAKTAKKYGIRHLILQNMLNTPKYTWGIQDLAKGRAMLRLVRSLEDDSFKVSLQARAGLDYFAPDIEKAKVQLAAVTMLMDDLEPENPDSPEIIHVVSYSEAVRLATPPIIRESIQITLQALRDYRIARQRGTVLNMAYDQEVSQRTEDLYDECREAIEILEGYLPNLYTPEGLYRIFEEGFLPVPYMLDPEHKYPRATSCRTALRSGGIRVIDGEGKPIRTADRYKDIIM